MVVEDNRNNMRLFKQILFEINEEFSITEAVSGTEAIKKATEHIFDIVFMDISLPDIDGIETCKALKKMPTFKNTTFIAATAHALKTDKEKLMLDFEYYLEKPIDEDKMIDLLHEILNE